jgi:hypothetical protein
MSLLQTANRLNTANQLKAWNEQTIQSMNSAKQTFTSIVTQRDAMIDNPDYTQEDIDEVNAMLLQLNELAISLTK